MTSRPASRTTRATPWAVLSVLAVAALGAYFAFESSAPLSIDVSWRQGVLLNSDSILYAIASFFAELGTSVGVSACGAISAALFFTIRQRREAAAILTALVIGVVMSESFKIVVERPRPIDAIYSYSGYSYPSGHSMGAAALAISIAYAIASIHAQGDIRVSRATVRWGWITALAWTLAMMWSRTALGVHWFSDVVAGALLGYAAAVFAQRIWVRRPVSVGVGGPAYNGPHDSH